MRGGPEYAARIKCAGRGGPARGVRALCGAGLNGAGRPALPPLTEPLKLRAVKMGRNPQANPAHHGFGLGRVEICLQILIRVDFLPGSFGLNLW